MDIFDKKSKLTENMFDGEFNKKRIILAKIVGIIVFIMKKTI